MDPCHGASGTLCDVKKKYILPFEIRIDLCVCIENL